MSGYDLVVTQNVCISNFMSGLSGLCRVFVSKFDNEQNDLIILFFRLVPSLQDLSDGATSKFYAGPPSGCMIFLCLYFKFTAFYNMYLEVKGCDCQSL